MDSFVGAHATATELSWLHCTRFLLKLSQYFNTILKITSIMACVDTAAIVLLIISALKKPAVPQFHK